MNHVGVLGTSHNRSDIGEEQFSSLPLSVRVRISVSIEYMMQSQYTLFSGLTVYKIYSSHRELRPCNVRIFWGSMSTNPLALALLYCRNFQCTHAELGHHQWPGYATALSVIHGTGCSYHIVRLKDAWGVGSTEVQEAALPCNLMSERLIDYVHVNRLIWRLWKDVERRHNCERAHTHKLKVELTVEFECTKQCV